MSNYFGENFPCEYDDESFQEKMDELQLTCEDKCKSCSYNKFCSREECIQDYKLEWDV